MIKKGDQGFYCIVKDFMCIKDDFFQVDYNVVDYFSLIMEFSVFSFVGLIGQFVGDGFIIYINGIELIDLLLGFKYLLMVNNNGKQVGI